MPVYPSGGTIAQSAGSPGFGPAPTPSFNASASVRFNSADSANISFTPTLQGNRSTWTMAFWFKRSSLSSRQIVVSNLNSLATIGFGIELNASDQLEIYDLSAASTFVTRLITTQVFRDPSQWYHLTLAYDTNQSTSSNRLKLYINGVQVTAFGTATYPAQFYQGYWNQAGVFSVIGKAGAYTSGTTFFYGGYLADMNFVDGLALTPSSFTATDANTGQLVPAQYTGNRGTNGFYLPFSGAALAVDLGQNPKTTAQDFPYWPYNTLLVDTTSTNGAQNNTFLDSSTNNFTITRNGNTTQGNFTPFNYGGGTTQANGYYSGYFDGTGDYLTATNASAFAFGTGDFTCELWCYLNSGTNNGLFQIASSVFPGVSGLAVSLVTNQLNIYYGASSQLYPFGYMTAGTWNHVALVRQSGALYVYLNGVRYTVVASDTTNYTGTTVGIGGYFSTSNLWNGYISNFRVVKGTAVYTANFTVPTTPLTNITNTSLLTCQSSQFIDNSTNAFAITTFGNTQPLPTNPFGMTAWSGYFDGTGDYLTVPSATATTLDADFTIEYFMYRPAAGNNWIFTLGDAFLSSGIETYIGSSGAAFNLYSANATRITSSTLPTIGAWSHVAMVRSGSTVTLYLNGVSLGTWTSSATFSGITYIGAERYNGGITGVFTGYLSNVRIVKGTAVYTSNFTPPTAPLTAISGTQLLTCQSSTFIDNSTNAFAITVNGNPYTLTLNNPFNSPVNYTTPPVQAWSYSFDGTGDFISVPTNTNTNMHQNGDWTYEGWIYWNSMPTTGYQNVFGQGTAGQNSFGLTAYNGTSWSAPYYFVVNQANIGNVLVGKTVLVANNWYHFAVVRRGGVVTLYVNGFAEGTYSNATNYAFGANPFTIGNSSNGYISNFRFVRSAVYTANFTPPTAPLTAIQNTQLLTCQSNRMVDNSLNNYTVTPSGNTAISPVSPFFPTTAWSAASYGGAMYFDGTGDSLSLPSSSQLAMGTGDFTWELWINQQASTSFRTFIDTRTGSGNLGLFFGTNTGTTNLYVSNDTTALITSSVSFNLNVWNHVALVRFSNTLTVYLNGAPVGSASYSANMTSTTGTIGAGVFSNPYVGYMSGLRILKGTALYTTAFVPPVLPPTAIANTQLLLNATNSGIYDATGQNVIETVGNAQVSTAVKKFGESSMSFDGSGDILIIQPTERMVFGTADFTVETWVYPTATQAQFATIVSNASTPNGWYLAFSTSNLVYFSNQATVAITSSSGLANNVWTHVAVSRVGTTIRMFFNGVQVASATNSTTYGVSTAVTYVASNGSTNYFLGYLQDLRVSKVGRYSGAFTPPAAAFAYNQYDIGNQQWLPTNISVTAGVNQDNLVDSPSDYGTDTGLGGQVRGNYATMSPIDTVGGTFANGNLDVGVTAAAGRYIRATIAPPSGKWYWEATVLSTTGTPSVGVVATTALPSGGVPVIGVTYSSNAVVTKDSTNLGTQTAWSVNDVVGIAYDADNLTIALYRNNAIQTTVNLTTGYIYAPLFMSYANVTATSAVAFNFGQRAFSYTAPAGFKCLVSTNLPTVNGIGATSSTRADDYFNPLLYTGNGVSGRTLTGVGFQPDLVWIKARNQAYSNQVTDVVRGPSKSLITNATAAEETNRSVGYVSALASDGFTVTTGVTNINEVNENTTTYVAWNWKANGAGVANTAGTLPSTVSANTTNGVSIVTYTSQSSGSGTIGHGLGVAPAMIINKPLTGSIGWSVYHESLGNLGALVLNTNAALTNNATYWNSTSPTTTVFSQGSAFAGLGTMVAYCFANVSGFSSLGSFTSNGAADNAFVYTGFAPRFIMLKVAAVGLTGNWIIFDTARNPTNIVGFEIYPNSNAAEVNSPDLDILSNGFKLRNAGFSSGTYIYAAFAQFPFKYSRAR